MRSGSAAATLILSLLNPLYFAEVLSGDGRTLVEQYLPSVPHAAVMEKLSELMRGILGDDRLEMPEIYLKEKRRELKELEKDRLVLDGQMQQTENQRAKLQSELAEKKALLSHTTAALAPLESKQGSQDFTALDAEIARLSAQYDAVQDGRRMTAARPCRQSWMRSGRRSLPFPALRSCDRCRDSCRHCTAGTTTKPDVCNICRRRAFARPACAVSMRPVYLKFSRRFRTACRRSRRTALPCGSRARRLRCRRRGQTGV